MPGQVAEPWAVWFAGLEDAVDRGLLEAAAEAELVSAVRAAPARGASVQASLAQAFATQVFSARAFFAQVFFAPIPAV